MQAARFAHGVPEHFQNRNNYSYSDPAFPLARIGTVETLQLDKPPDRAAVRRASIEGKAAMPKDQSFLHLTLWLLALRDQRDREAIGATAEGVCHPLRRKALLGRRDRSG